MYCDNWETEFPQATLDSKLMQRPGVGIMARNPMRDLMDAYARLQYDDDDDGDTESESTYVSHHRDKLHVFPGLDDYMMDCSGTVTRLGTHKRVHDTGDWADDVNVPSFLPPRASKQHVDSLDDLLLDDAQPPAPPPTPVSGNSQPSDEPLPPRTPLWMPSRNDPDRHAAALGNPTDEPIPPRLPPWVPRGEPPNRRSATLDNPADEPLPPRTPPWMPSRGDPGRRAVAGKRAQEEAPPAPPIRPARLTAHDDPMDEPIPPNKPPWVPTRGDPNRRVRFGAVDEHRALTPEDDNDDDNLDHIELPNDLTTLQLKPRPRAPSPSPPPPSKPPVRMPYQETEDDEDFCVGVCVDSDSAFRQPSMSQLLKQAPAAPAPLSRTSMIPRRVVSSNSKPTPARLHAAPARSPAPAARKPVHDNSARPGMSRKVYGDGTELDGLDILPQWRRHSLSFWKRENRMQGGVDPKRPWRHNMVRAGRKLTLIKPSDQLVNQEYNEMKYDPVRCCWQGNENSMLSFGDAKPYRRPALISNMSHKLKQSKQQTGGSGVVVGSMVFDPAQMCWKKVDNDEEDKIFARIADLDATGQPADIAGTTAHAAAASAADAIPEFDLPRHVQHQMRHEEENHREQMGAWSHGGVTSQNRRTHAHMLYNM